MFSKRPPWEASLQSKKPLATSKQNSFFSVLEIAASVFASATEFRLQAASTTMTVTRTSGFWQNVTCLVSEQSGCSKMGLHAQPDVWRLQSYMKMESPTANNFNTANLYGEGFMQPKGVTGKQSSKNNNETLDKHVICLREQDNQQEALIEDT